MVYMLDAIKRIIKMIVVSTYSVFIMIVIIMYAAFLQHVIDMEFLSQIGRASCRERV